MNRQPLLTLNQAADHLGLDRDTVARHIFAGDLKAADVSAGQGLRPRYRIDPRDLDRFVESRRIKAA